MGTYIIRRLLQMIPVILGACLLYTSDAADERSSVDLGGRRIIKKKKYLQRLGMRAARMDRDAVWIASGGVGRDR